MPCYFDVVFNTIEELIKQNGKCLVVHVKVLTISDLREFREYMLINEQDLKWLANSQCKVVLNEGFKRVLQINIIDIGQQVVKEIRELIDGCEAELANRVRSADKISQKLELAHKKRGELFCSEEIRLRREGKKWFEITELRQEIAALNTLMWTIVLVKKGWLGSQDLEDNDGKVLIVAEYVEHFRYWCRNHESVDPSPEIIESEIKFVEELFNSGNEGGLMDQARSTSRAGPADLSVQQQSTNDRSQKDSYGSFFQGPLPVDPELAAGKELEVEQDSHGERRSLCLVM